MKLISSGTLLVLLAVPIGLTSGQTCESDGNGGFKADYSTEDECLNSPHYQGNPEDCSFFIYTEDDCRTAATAAGLSKGTNFPFSQNFAFFGQYPSYSAGCYYYTSGTYSNIAFFGSVANLDPSDSTALMECDDAGSPVGPSELSCTWSADRMRLKKTTVSLPCTPLTACADTPCQNEGTCTDEADGYTCTCTGGYSGTDCEIAPCSGDDWCVHYKNIATATVGETADDEIVMKFFASAIPDNNIKYYTVRMMNKDCSEFVSHASIVAYSPIYANDELSVTLNIDTGKLNASPWITSTAGAESYTAEFCVKVDLKATLDGDEYFVATERVKMTMDVNLAKNFVNVEGFSANAETNRDAGTKYIATDYPLSACVCDQSNACISPDPILPGGEFAFCVKTTSQEVFVSDVRDIVFDNSQLTTSIPIIKTDGSTFGPSTSKSCNEAGVSEGICRITARTYAQLYEKSNTNDPSTLVDISGSNSISGTGILAFVNSRRLGATAAHGSSKIVTATTARELQEDGATPVNDFDMDMNLATPPDRSSAASIARGVVGYVTLMLGGMVGFAMF